MKYNVQYLFKYQKSIVRKSKMAIRQREVQWDKRLSVIDSKKFHVMTNFHMKS